MSTTDLLSTKDGLITPCSPGPYILRRKKIKKVTEKRIAVCEGALKEVSREPSLQDKKEPAVQPHKSGWQQNQQAQRP